MLKILLPTDFSENAWNAISYSLRLFKEVNCTFYLLHTYTPAFYRMDYLVGGPSFSAIPDTGVKRSLEGLEKTLKEIELKYPNSNHSFELVSSFNLLTDEINHLAKKKDIDYIVMGTQGATSAREIFMGTNTVYVMRKARIPVLIIPSNYTFTPVKKILFPTDYWSQYKIEELNTLLKITEMCKGEITVLHVKEEYDLGEDQEDNKAYLEACLNALPHEFQELKGNLMPNAILDYIDAHEFEMLVMMNRRHSFLERLLWKQNVDQIGFQVQIPFLVIPDTAQIT